MVTFRFSATMQIACLLMKVSPSHRSIIGRPIDGGGLCNGYTKVGAMDAAPQRQS
jgi:hypothetical protein